MKFEKQLYKLINEKYLGEEQDDKMSVEEKYRGPHEFKPQFRGDCFTAPFDVDLHPVKIKYRLPYLQDKINNQMEKYRWINNT